MAQPANILGIDIGSAALVVAEIDPAGTLLKFTYDFHYGQPNDCLKRALDRFDLYRVAGIAATSSTPSTIKVTQRYDNRVAVLAAARRYYPQVRSIHIHKLFKCYDFDSIVPQSQAHFFQIGYDSANF